MTSTQKVLIGSGVAGLCLAAAGGLLTRMDWSAPEVDTGRVEVVRERPEDAPPNIIVVLVDDAGHADFGMTGSPHFDTPNIDSLAVDGVRFTQAYVTAPVCSPSRAGLLSGRYQQRFGHEANPPPGVANAGLPTHVKTLADRLKPRGYRTAAVGKWHLGTNRPFIPNKRGFEHFYGFLSGERSYFENPKKGPQAMRLERKWADEDFEYLTDELGEHAASWISEHAHEPFFLYLAYSAVHMPLDALQEDLAEQHESLKGPRRRLAAMTTALDRSVGVVLDALEENDLTENTVVFFLNDNGAGKKNHGDNAPFRSGKGRVYEGGIHVPMVVRWPGVAESGARFDGTVSSLDIAKTALSIAGDPGGEELDGVDLTPYLDGSRAGSPHPLLFWRLGESWAVRKDDWKLLSDKGGPVELYDLAGDPGESTDLAAAQIDVVVDLQRRFDAWNAQLRDPVFQSNTEKRKAGKAKKDAKAPK